MIRSCIFYLLLSAVNSSEVGEYDKEKIFDFFSSKINQIKFIIQAPLKGYFSWMGVWVLSIVWFWIRGDLFPRDPRVLMMYNLQFSTTWAAQHSIKNLGYAVIFIIFSYIFAAELQEIDVNLSRVKRQIESEFTSPPEETFFDSVVIPACKQLFESKGIVKDFITSILVMISKIIFWVICNTILPPLPNPGRYFHIE